jgi:molybdopterin-biosynthesis enzyme MoeA-like protein
MYGLKQFSVDIIAINTCFDGRPRFCRSETLTFEGTSESIVSRNIDRISEKFGSVESKSLITNKFVKTPKFPVKIHI